MSHLGHRHLRQLQGIFEGCYGTQLLPFYLDLPLDAIGSVCNLFGLLSTDWGGRVIRWCWVNFQCRGVLFWIIIRQGPTVFAVSAGGNYLDIFLSSIISLSLLSSSLWQAAKYRIKYSLKRPFKPKQQTNQVDLDLNLILCVDFVETFN